MAKIYKIINDINSKIYVGQTHKDINERFKRHCQEAKWKNTKKMPIVLAIRKYGKAHFSIYLLEDLPKTFSQLQIDEKEVEWGLKLKCFSPNGYNLKLGGARGLLSDETKIKIAKSNRGKFISDKTRQRLSQSHKGYRRSIESRRKQSITLEGKSPHKNTAIGASKKNSKTYILKNLNGERIIISNMKKFCEENHLHRSDMSMLCTGKSESYKGWILIENQGFNK